MKPRPKSRPNRSADAGVTLSARIQPRASKNGISSLEDGSYKIRLTAPPVDGAANEALVGYLSGVLKVGTSSIEIVAGHTARQKRIKITGIGEEDVRHLLNEAGK